MAENDPINRALRDSKFGQTLRNAGFALERVRAFLAFAQVVAKAAVKQAPARPALHQYDVGRQWHTVVFRGRVHRGPARARYGAKHRSAIQTKAAAVEPVQAAGIAEIQSVQAHD